MGFQTNQLSLQRAIVHQRTGVGACFIPMTLTQDFDFSYSNAAQDWEHDLDSPLHPLNIERSRIEREAAKERAYQRLLRKFEFIQAIEDPVRREFTLLREAADHGLSQARMERLYRLWERQTTETAEVAA